MCWESFYCVYAYTTIKKLLLLFYYNCRIIVILIFRYNINYLFSLIFYYNINDMNTKTKKNELKMIKLIL